MQTITDSRHGYANLFHQDSSGPQIRGQHINTAKSGYYVTYIFGSKYAGLYFFLGHCAP